MACTLALLVFKALQVLTKSVSIMLLAALTHLKLVRYHSDVQGFNLKLAASIRCNPNGEVAHTKSLLYKTEPKNKNRKGSARGCVPVF